MKKKPLFSRFTLVTSLLFVLLFIQGCRCHDDCISFSSVSFNLIDAQTGKDLVFDMNVPLSEIVLKDSRNETMEVYQGNGVLNATIYNYSNQFHLNYQNKMYSFDLAYVKTESKCCDGQNLTAISSDDAEISMQGSDFIIKI